MGRKGRFYGFDLAKPIYDACKESIKAYPYLKDVQENLDRISGFRKDYADQVIRRVALEQRIREIEDAFEQVPESYREAVKYYLFTKDTNEIRRYKVRTVFGRDFQETAIWVRKLIYLYAKQIGYPVSCRSTEHELVIDDDGNLNFLW